MSFLNPTALFALGLLAIPVLAHIFKPRRVRQMPFSSLRWLRASQHRMSRHLRWHQILLFLLRVAVLSLFVLALARPVVSPQTGPTAPVERVVLIDASRSMGFSLPDGPSPFKRAKRMARQLLSQPVPGMRTTVVVAGPGNRLLGPLKRDASAYATPVEGLRLRLGEANLSSALRAAEAALSDARPDASAELVVLTDNRVRNWSQTDIEQFHRRVELPTDVRVVDVSSPSPENVWIADRELSDGSLRVDLAASGPHPCRRTVRLDIPGRSALEKDVTVRVGRLASVRFELPRNGKNDLFPARVSLDPSDGLPSDDVCWITAPDVDAVHMLLLEQRANAGSAAGGGAYVQAALSALEASSARSFRIARQAAADVVPRQIEDADVIWLIDAPRLPGRCAETLRRQVRRGAGLIVFAGPSMDPAFYNAQLGAPAGPGEGPLLPARLGDVVTPPGGIARLVPLRDDHPILGGLQDPAYNGLVRTRFHRFWSLSLRVRASVRPLANFDTGTPAIVASLFGEGEVVLINTTADDRWSDLPRTAGFIALVDHMVDHLAEGRGHTRFEVGKRLQLRIPQADPETSATIELPTGTSVDVPLRRRASAALLELPRTEAVGLYRVAYQSRSGEGKRMSVAVQASPQESDLSAMDEDLLQTWWGPSRCVIDRRGDRDSGPEPALRAHMLSPWFVALACAALLAEMALVHRYCPAMTPALSTPVVRHRGMLGRNES